MNLRDYPTSHLRHNFKHRNSVFIDVLHLLSVLDFTYCSSNVHNSVIVFNFSPCKMLIYLISNLHVFTWHFSKIFKFSVLKAINPYHTSEVSYKHLRCHTNIWGVIQTYEVSYKHLRCHTILLDKFEDIKRVIRSRK